MLGPVHVPPTVLKDFRKQLREAVEGNRAAWGDSRRMVAPSVRVGTLQRLRAAVAGSALDPTVREELLRVLILDDNTDNTEIPGEALRHLTGLNPTKAIRNLCLLLGVEADEREDRVSSMPQEALEAAVRGTENPFDLLLEADVASVVDYGAGDLTFEEELADRYLEALAKTGRDLTIHALDRLDPQEGFGELVRAGQDRLHRLQHHPSSRLKFQFWGNRDMLNPEGLQVGWPRYTVAVCNSPSSPTFAWEPSRLSAPLIQDRLRATKGDFRRRTVKGKDVLEVLHGEERLTFPAWKFDIYGPLALLDRLSRKGKLCILGAVDMEVFWEILSQLLPDDRARPRDVFFSADNVHRFFGPMYDRLVRLPIGERTVLDQTRQDIPRVLGPAKGKTHAFRYVEIRRGAVLPGVPAGRTARVFDQMTREAPPWFLTLIPAE
jgi:hypothetical protein